jgi:hypothetical protein
LLEELDHVPHCHGEDLASEEPQLTQVPAVTLEVKPQHLSNSRRLRPYGGTTAADQVETLGPGHSTTSLCQAARESPR